MTTGGSRVAGTDGGSGGTSDPRGTPGAACIVAGMDLEHEHDRHRWTDPRTRATDAVGTDGALPTGTVTRTGPDQVTVVSGGVTVAQADVVVEDAQVVVRFWVAARSLSPDTRDELVRTAFAHESLPPRQRVLATVPHEDCGLLEQLRQILTVTSSHVAGATCLLEGRVA